MIERWLSPECVRAALGDPPRARSIQVLKWAWLDRWFARAHPALPALLFAPVALGALGYARRHTACSAAELSAAFSAGLLAFSLLEYALHRFVFHHSFGSSRRERITAFLTHGYHHLYPNDAGRLVLPPVLTAPFALLVAAGYALSLPLGIACAAFAGTSCGYVAYDSAHWWLHHAHARSRLGRLWKRYHALHHHDRSVARFGVTTPLWDLVFGTFLPTERAHQQASRQS